MKRYEFTGITKTFEGRTLQQIRWPAEAFTDNFWFRLKAKVSGHDHEAFYGWLENERNCPQEGEGIVCGDGVAMDEAVVVSGIVYKNACVYGKAAIDDHSAVSDFAKVFGSALIKNSKVSGLVSIGGYAKLEGVDLVNPSGTKINIFTDETK